jgi:hypothetical protein
LCVAASLFFTISSIKVVWDLVDYSTIRHKITNDLPFIAHSKLPENNFSIEAHLPLHNISRKMVKIKVPVLEWSLGNKISQHNLGESQISTVMPFQSLKMMTVPIVINKREDGHSISGKLKIRMEYGKDSEKEHFYEMRYNVYIAFSEDGTEISSVGSTISL